MRSPKPEFLKETRLVPIKKLKEHEKSDLKRLVTVKQLIASDDSITKALVVDKKTKVVLNGEHRLTALRELGCSRVPVVFVDYESPEIQVEAWRAGERLTKEMVVAAGLTGRTLPAKTSRHMVKLNGRFEHISILGVMIKVPLEKLKE